jgi:hypothetical protein
VGFKESESIDIPTRFCHTSSLCSCSPLIDLRASLLCWQGLHLPSSDSSLQNRTGSSCVSGHCTSYRIATVLECVPIASRVIPLSSHHYYSAGDLVWSCCTGCSWTTQTFECGGIATRHRRNSDPPHQDILGFHSSLYSFYAQRFFPLNGFSSSSCMLSLRSAAHQQPSFLQG